MNSKRINVNEKEDHLYFGNETLTLIFDLSTGEWTETLYKGNTIQKGATTELTLITGGLMHSSLSDKEPNGTWARLILDGGEDRPLKPVFGGYEYIREQDGVTLSIKGEADGFIVTRTYRLTYTGILERSFIIRSTLEEKIALRYAKLCTPVFIGALIDEKRVIYRDTYALLHNPEDTVSYMMWGGEIRETPCAFTAQETDGGWVLQTDMQPASWIEPGEAAHFGTSFFTVEEKPWLDAILTARDHLEQRGIRTTIGDKSHLNNLVIYETEIGLIHFRDDKEHHVYDSLSELEADLPRLKAIGYNTVQMMPSFPFPGYSVYDLKRPTMQHSFGADLKPFIAHAHALGMRVMFDILMHGFIDREIARYDQTHYIPRKHYYPEWEKQSEYEVTPYRAEHPDWFIYEESGDIFKLYTWSIDWANRGAQDYLAEALAYCVTELDIDGFRFDAPTWVNAPTWSEDLPYRGDRALCYGAWEAFQRARQTVEPLKEKLIWLTENENIYMRDVIDVSYTYSTSGLWPKLFTGELKARDLQDYYIARRRMQPKGALYVNWLDNHDSWNDGVRETGLFTAELYNVEYARALLIISLFQEGAYMAYSGTEKLDPLFYTTALQTFNAHDIFWKGTFSFEQCRADSDDVYTAYWKYGEEEAVIVVNLSAKAVETGINGVSGSFTDLLDGVRDDLSGHIKLPTYGTRVYWRKHV